MFVYLQGSKCEPWLVYGNQKATYGSWSSSPTVCSREQTQVARLGWQVPFLSDPSPRLLPFSFWRDAITLGGGQKTTWGMGLSPSIMWVPEPPHQTCIFPCERRESRHNVVLDLPRTLKTFRTPHFHASLLLPTLAFICSLVLRMPAALTHPLLAAEASARSTMRLRICWEFLSMARAPLYLSPFTQNFTRHILLSLACF